MGAPQTDTKNTGASIPWTLKAVDHISTGVVKGGLPAVDGEDGKLWDVMKFERQEFAKLMFSDGVFLGNVWGDGVSRDSFKCSWSAGALGVAPGRAIMAGKRLDLGLTGTYDGAFTAAMALPAAAHEKIVYLDVFERIVTPTPAFAAAGIGMDLNVYADFSSYNGTNSTIKEQTVLTGAALSAAGAGHTFMEIGRLSSAGVMTDTRQRSMVKSPANPDAFALCVLENVSSAVVGINCTHTSFTQAVLDLSLASTLSPSGAKKILLFGGSSTLNGALAIPSGCHLVGLDRIQRMPNIGAPSTFTVLDHGWSDSDYPGLLISAAWTSGQFESVSNITVQSAGGFISNFSKTYRGCNILSTVVASSIRGAFYDCKITWYANNNVTGTYMQNCRWMISTTNPAILSTGSMKCENCLVQLSTTGAGAVLTVSGAALRLNNCNIEVLGSNAATIANVVYCSSGEVKASNSEVYSTISSGNSPRLFVVDVTGQMEFHSTRFSAVCDSYISSWTASNGAAFAALNCSFGYGATHAIDVNASATLGQVVTANIMNCTFADVDFFTNIINGQNGTVSVFLLNCSFLNATVSLFSQATSSSTYTLMMNNCVVIKETATATAAPFNFDWKPTGVGNAHNVIVNNSTLRNNSAASVYTNVTINAANLNYLGAIGGGGTFAAATAAGPGANAGNIQTSL